MNTSKNEEIMIKFIVRRAFRCRSVSRADLVEAINVSSATATRMMSYALKHHGDILERKGHNLVPKPLAKCPKYADEEDLLKNLDSGYHAPIITGLFEKELPVTYVSWTNSMPPRAGTLQTIVTAIQRKKQIDIVYIGLKRNQQPRNRKILPLGLEKMNDQWRVIAQDMEIKNFPVKVFVLPRIMASSMSSVSTRSPYIQNYQDSITELHVNLNHNFNSDQKKIFAHELKVKNGKVSIATRSLHDFKRRFTDTPPSDDIVWPPLILKEN